MPVQMDVEVFAKDRAGNPVTVKQMTSQPPMFIEAETVAGQVVLIPANEPTTKSTTVTVECDGQHCGEKKAVIKWNEELVKDDTMYPPVEAYRIVVIELFDGAKYVFCSRKCAQEFLTAHPLVLSPEEKQSKVTDIGVYKTVQKLEANDRA